MVSGLWFLMPPGPSELALLAIVRLKEKGLQSLKSLAPNQHVAAAASDGARLGRWRKWEEDSSSGCAEVPGHVAEGVG